MKITTTTFVVCFIINSFPAFAESEFILNSKAKKSYKETIECIKSSGNNISVCLKETITYIKSENKLLKTYKKNKKGIKRKQNIINFLKKSSDKFVGKYKESRNNKDYKQSLNTTKVYYAVTKDEDYKKIIEELKSLGKGGTASDIMAKLLEKMPIGNEYDKYVNEYNKRVLVLKDDIKKKTIKYGEEKIESFITQFNETITDINNNILISSRISYSEYIIAIKTDRIDTRESDVNNLKQQIINLVNKNNDNIIIEYNNIIIKYKSYDFKDCRI